MSLMTRNLFENLTSLHRELDTLFERNWSALDRALPDVFGDWGGFCPEVETYTKDTNLVYRLAIPGVDPKEIDLSITGGQIVVKGERKVPTETKEGNWLVREFRYGRFERSFALPEGADLEKIEAAFVNGLLEITVPVSKTYLPRKVQIKQVESGEEKPRLKASA